MRFPAILPANLYADIEKAVRYAKPTFIFSFYSGL